MNYNNFNQEFSKPLLTEPGVKYFLNQTLKQCSEFKSKHHNLLLNIGLFFLFIFILGGLLIYKYTGKLPGFFLDTTNTLVETTRTDFSNLDISATRSNFTLGVKNILNVQNIETTKQSGAAHTTDMQLWGRSLFAKYVLYL